MGKYLLEVGLLKQYFNHLMDIKKIKHRYTALCFAVMIFLTSSISYAQHIKYLKVIPSDFEQMKIKNALQAQRFFYENIFIVDTTVTLQIYIAKSKREFDSIKLSRGIIHAAGFFNKKSQTIFTYRKARFLNTIYHEANHFTLSQSKYEIPMWLNEGLSEFFERVRFNEKKSYFILDKKQKSIVLKTKAKFNDIIQLSHREWKDASDKSEKLSRSHYKYALMMVINLINYDSDKSLLFEVLTSQKKSDEIENFLMGKFNCSKRINKCMRSNFRGIECGKIWVQNYE
jgi:hypothetical protein